MKSQNKNELKDCLKELDAQISGKIKNNVAPIVPSNQEFMIAEGLHPKRSYPLEKDAKINHQIPRNRIFFEQQSVAQKSTYGPNKFIKNN